MSERMSNATTPHIVARTVERDALGHLNDRMSAFVTRVHAVQEATKSIENAALKAHTTALDNEVHAIKCMYEDELDNVRSQLNQMTADRNDNELSAKKHIVLSCDLEKRLSTETNNRKKLEVSLGDSHRLLNEKEAQNQDLQVSNAELQNHLIDTQTKLDTSEKQLAAMSNDHDAECSKRKELQMANLALDDEIKFNVKKHQAEAQDLNNRIAGAESTIKTMEERLKEHDIIDEALAQQLKKVKAQSHSDLIRYQEDAEHCYKSSLASVNKQLGTQTDNFNKSAQECIKLKALLEETKASLKKANSKAETAEDHNKALIHEMEVDRTHTSNVINMLEDNLRVSEQTIDTKNRELNQAHNAVIPVELEIAGITGYLESEERRLGVQSTKAAPEVIAKSSISRPLTCAATVPRAARPSARRMFENSQSVQEMSARTTLPPINNYAPSSRVFNQGHKRFPMYY